MRFNGDAKPNLFKNQHADAMTNRIEKLDRIKDIDAFLLTSPASLKYLTGYFYNFEIGPSPFQLIPAALFVISTLKYIFVSVSHIASIY